MKRIYLILIITALAISSCSTHFTREDKGDYILVRQEGGSTLGYAKASGEMIIGQDGKAFKDLNRNGKLDPYEDWRLPADKRARDLASKMSIEQIAGLMLYSSHQAIPSENEGWVTGHYGGMLFNESGASPSDLTDEQQKFLSEDNLRHVLIIQVESPAVAAQWNNNIQASAEKTGLGIPVNISSDPRHETRALTEYNAGAGGDISLWPTTLGLAATFDPAIMKQFGEIASQEYRGLGITTALSPQIDLATEPRWSRFDGTLGEDPDLTTDMARAYVDGFQTSYGDKEIADGWGYSSVNAMVKHWPGGGPEEGGRDAHFGYGAYAVYPGENLEDHLQAFTEGAFKLEGKTSMASAVMPYYTISYNIDPNGENVGNSFNRYIITDLLREKYGFDGVVCTDWGITHDVISVGEFSGKCWGVELLTEVERHYKALEAGVDQFGGNNEMQPVIDAYNMGIATHGEAYMRQRFEASAVRLLRNMFRVGLFENPYLDIEHTKATVGKPEFMEAGYQAQLKSIVMLKNRDQVLPVQKKLKVYIPKRHTAAGKDWIGWPVEESWDDCFRLDIAGRYFEVVTDPKEADFAMVSIRNPRGGQGYDEADLKSGGNGYLPISLQYREYTAGYAREQSIAGGSPYENSTNRSYKNKSVKSANKSDMELVADTRKKMGDKPVIVVVNVSKPMIFSEIEPYASAILVHMGVQDQAILDMVSGAVEPSALLPFQMPANMKTVELQLEDVPRDMEPYRDSEGNRYDFAFGMNWSGVIRDERVEKYK
ncbi:MAG: glycoside hydrolase family 3 C-terminal domain-containing protein [Bacteroidales bacterium]|nr:glycoside hydrolase family 3 C-terminal domain-containing protein [Bacteroidales bacterium]